MRILVALPLIFFLVGCDKEDSMIPQAMEEWETIDFPGALETDVQAIENGKIIGNYGTDNGSFAFTYDRSEWITLDIPSAGISGADGNNIIGNENGGGFVYDGEIFTTISKPGADVTLVHDIDGEIIVGRFEVENSRYGFVYDGQTWETIIPPDPYPQDRLVVAGIDGNKLAGHFQWGENPGESIWHGFILDDNEWTIIDPPDGSFNNSVIVSGIDGDGVVGMWGDHGFIYMNGTWTNLDFPGSEFTQALGVKDGQVFGRYFDSTGFHGFIYTPN